MAGGAPSFVAACASESWSQAIQACTRSLRSDKDNAGLLCDRALCYIQLDLNKHAIKDCDAALKCAGPGKVPKALLIKGQALAKLGRFPEAIACWQEAQEHHLNDNCDNFDLGHFLLLKQLVKTHSQESSITNTPSGFQSSFSATSEPEASPSLSSEAVIERTSPAVLEPTKAIERLEKDAGKQLQSSTITDPVQPSDRDTRASVDAEKNECKHAEDAAEKAKDKSQAESVQVGSAAGLNVPHSKTASSQGPTSTDGTDFNIRSHPLSSQTSSQTATNPEARSKSVNKSSFNLSPSQKREERPNGKPNGRKADSPNHGAARSRTAEGPSETSQPRRSSSRGNGNSNVGSRSGGVASCSGREERAQDRAEIRGAISKDRENENGGEASPRETEEGNLRRKGKGDVELPPKIIVNGMDWRVQKGIGEVNAGNLDDGIAIFDKILESEPSNADALVGRGSALAMQSNQFKGAKAGRAPITERDLRKHQRKLEKAVADFSKAIDIRPRSADSWKRRGQAKVAMGLLKEGIADMTEALRLEPTSADTLSERGACYLKLRDFVRAEADFRAFVSREPRNVEGLRLLGRCLISRGECRAGIDVLLKAAKLDPEAKDIYANIAQAYKEISDAERATMYFEKALVSTERSVNTYHLWGMLRYGLGDHRGALELFDKVLKAEPRSLECKYLKAACLHAIGQYTEAVLEYNNCLKVESTDESIVVAYLAYYQREVARYTAAKQWAPLDAFDIDEDLHPVFKEAWCKKLNPTIVVAHFDPQKQWEQAEKAPGGEQGDVRARHRRQLLTLADKIGARVQYFCDGFLRNSRQHRMAGLAALEVAQSVSATWQAMFEARQDAKTGGGEADSLTQADQLQAPFETPPTSPSEPPPNTASTREADTPPPSPSGVSPRPKRSPRKANGTSRKGRERFAGQARTMGWRAVFDTVVKWRQIVEPCDQVVWVDMLSEKEFAAGFGSHTPLLIGQQKVVRYYPNFPRAFAVAKDLMLAKDEVRNARDAPVFLLEKEQRAAIVAATECGALYDVIKEDFWISTPCYSVTQPGKVLDGTRLTVQKQRDVENAYEFSIRTPCTPDRWKKFDKELACAWEAVCSAACARLECPADEERSRRLWDSILTLVFYWYNFMPLCRGTAVVGYVTLLGLFLAAGMEVTANIPPGLQVDWEAILTPDVEVFASAVRPWLYPSLKPIDLTGDTGGSKSVPKVVDAFPTVQSVVAALSTAETKWRDVDRG